MLKRLHHHNIIVYYGTVTLDDVYYIVMELAENGSLWDYLHNAKASCILDLNQSLCWSKGIAAGVRYLHQQKLLHRDLKSPNVLLKEDTTAKIADFVLAKFTYDTSSVVSTPQSSVHGTHQWMSPEAIKSKNENVSEAHQMCIPMALFSMNSSRIQYHLVMSKSMNYKN